MREPDRRLTALGFGKLCLRLPSAAWSWLPSADGTELAGLSTRRPRPEEAVSTRPTVPASRDLAPKARPTEAAPRPSTAGERQRDGAATLPEGSSPDMAELPSG